MLLRAPCRFNECLISSGIVLQLLVVIYVNRFVILTGGMAAGEALAPLGDYRRLPSAKHLCIHLPIWETTL